MQAAVGVVQKGLRPPIPSGTPQGVTQLLRRCWARSPEDRPSFAALKVAPPGCCACVWSSCASCGCLATRVACSWATSASASASALLHPHCSFSPYLFSPPPPSPSLPLAFNLPASDQRGHLWQLWPPGVSAAFWSWLRCEACMQELFQEQWEAAQRDEDQGRRSSTSGLLSKLRKNMKGPGG